ncbi:hypothetical protein MRX96_005699 [Rhipicephalus microplus]
MRPSVLLYSLVDRVYAFVYVKGRAGKEPALHRGAQSLWIRDRGCVLFGLPWRAPRRRQLRLPVWRRACGGQLVKIAQDERPGGVRHQCSGGDIRSCVCRAQARRLAACDDPTVSVIQHHSSWLRGDRHAQSREGGVDRLASATGKVD